MVRQRQAFFLAVSARRLVFLASVFICCFCLGALLGASELLGGSFALLKGLGRPATGSGPGQPVLELPPGPLANGVLKDLLIVLDPGHGGADRGVCHFPDDLIEKEINLDMANRVRAVLEAAGARVLLTRADDVFLSLDDRARAANEAGAHLFLSLHVNRIPGHPECFGAQTFYFPGSTQGERLASIIQEELIKVDPENYRDPLPGSYRVLRLTTMPGALVEIGFMTNARDRELIATEAYRDRIARAIAAGVARYVAEQGLTAGKDQTPS